MAAPHLSRVVEDCPSAVALSELINAGVTASPSLVIASIPGKCVAKDEEEKP